jgi:hypothetical protein
MGGKAEAVAVARRQGRRELGRLRATDQVILLVCLILAAALRLQDIQQPLVDWFSWRQASTAMMADNFRLGSWNVFYPAVSWSGDDPAYQGREFQIVSYITAILHALFGWHDWYGRLVAVVFGLWTLFALHRLTDCIWGTAHAHMAALAYAIMPGAIMIDRSFLPEPGMLALVTTGVWMLVRYLQEERWPFLAAAGVFLTLGILAKIPGIAVGVPCLWLAIVWLVRGRVRQATAMLIVGALTLSLVIAYYAWAVHLGRTYPPYHIAGHGYIWDYGFRHFLSEKFYLGRAWHEFRRWYLVWPLIMLVLIGLLHRPPPRPLGADATFVWIFHVWLAGATLVYLAAALEITNNHWNFHVFTAPLAAFAGRGMYLAVGFATGRWARAVTAARLAIVAGFVIFATQPALRAIKEPQAGSGFRLGQSLNALSEPGELVITMAHYMGDPVAIYYSRRRGWVFPPAHRWADTRSLSHEEKALDYLQELRGRGARWFGVTKDARDWNREPITESYTGLLAHLEATAELVADTPDYLIFRLD